MSDKQPRHIAIIMDGNGRWAKQRHLPRIAGHRAGVESVRQVVQSCVEHQIEILSLFVFSSENWRRPKTEVGGLLSLFFKTLKKEIDKLHEQNIQLRFIGDRTAFSPDLQQAMQQAETLTADNKGLKLILAVNYGGRWDLLQAAKRLAAKVAAGALDSAAITNEDYEQFLALAGLPEPDLFIRTSGELRLSNYFLWQLAYTELYFTETLWPDFHKQALEAALTYFATRQRRFGYTSEQLANEQREKQCLNNA